MAASVRATASGNVIPFPAATPPASAERTCRRSAEALIAALRQAARDAQVSPPMDLDRLCAEGSAAGDAALWALALVRTAARGGQALVFHRSNSRMISATECWLASLVQAAGLGDADSVEFLSRRFLAQADRRLAVCFAQRLAREPRIAAAA